jgi:hypothetical protein
MTIVTMFGDECSVGSAPNEESSSPLLSLHIGSLCQRSTTSRFRDISDRGLAGMKAGIKTEKS